MPTRKQIIGLLKPFPEKGDPSVWLKDYITAPLKLDPELEVPPKAVYSEIAENQTSSSEELKALDAALRNLRKKMDFRFCRSFRRTTTAIEKRKAELEVEKKKVAEQQAKLNKLKKLTQTHLRDHKTMMKLVDKKNASKIKGNLSAVAQEQGIELDKAKLKMNNLKWRIKNAKPLLKQNWMETLTSFSEPKLPKAIEWLVAPKYLFMKYSDMSDDARRVDFTDTYEFYSLYEYEVADVALGYKEDESPWKNIKENKGFCLNNLQHFQVWLNDETEPRIFIQEENNYDEHTLDFSNKKIKVGGDQSRPLYWFDFSQEGKELTVIRGGV